VNIAGPREEKRPGIYEAVLRALKETFGFIRWAVSQPSNRMCSVLADELSRRRIFPGLAWIPAWIPDAGLQAWLPQKPLFAAHPNLLLCLSECQLL